MAHIYKNPILPNGKRKQGRPPKDPTLKFLEEMEKKRKIEEKEREKQRCNELNAEYFSPKPQSYQTEIKQKNAQTQTHQTENPELVSVNTDSIACSSSSSKNDSVDVERGGVNADSNADVASSTSSKRRGRPKTTTTTKTKTKTKTITKSEKVLQHNLDSNGKSFTSDVKNVKNDEKSFKLQHSIEKSSKLQHSIEKSSNSQRNRGEIEKLSHATPVIYNAKSLQNKTAMTLVSVFSAELRPDEIEFMLKYRDELNLSHAEITALSLLNHMEIEENRKQYWKIQEIMEKQSKKAQPVSTPVSLLDDRLAKAENAIFGEIISEKPIDKLNNQ